MKKREYSLEIAGKKITAIFSDLADQANGSAMVTFGETTVLATVVMSNQEREGIDFFPLIVDYEEKFYAAGRILGGRFIKREGRPSDEAVLTGRIVDRTIRPLFNQNTRHEVQVVVTVLSFDDKNDPDIPAVIAASLALSTSDIPWAGPVSAVRIALDKENSQIVNPEYDQLEEMNLDLLVCGKDGNINMIEAEGKEVNEEKVSEVITKASEIIEQIQAWQQAIIEKEGKEKKEIETETSNPEIATLFKQAIEPELPEAVFSDSSKTNSKILEKKWLTLITEKLGEETKVIASKYFEEQVDKILHTEALTNERRADGRKMDEVRSLYAEAGGISSIVHGTGIFYRGGTHILTTLTLSGPKDSQIVEGMEISEKKYFMHHYNFPPFSVGETGRVGGMNRRAIGHGALAEKSLRAVLPDRNIFPYTIRLVSEAMASNGSTSMGSVCASTLAMMDGGVPIKRPVAGIAMGVMMDDQGHYKILTDIQGPEDHFGDMDLKVAGTTEGITGMQMDIKVDGIPVPIIIEALTGAQKARLHILETITGAIAEPRPEIKESAPKIIQISINPEKIGAVIGPGGKVIQQITADTGAEIEIEDDGTVYITGNTEGANTAKDIIADITRVYKAGDKFDGQVTRLMDFGAFVRIGRDKEGLVHVSEFAPFRVEKVTDFVKEGDQVPVVIKEIDDKGRINLSIKQADSNFFPEKN